MLRYGCSKHLLTTNLPPCYLHLNRCFIAAFAISFQLRNLLILQQSSKFSSMPKRKSSAALAQPLPLPDLPLQVPVIDDGSPLPKRRARSTKSSQTKASTNPDENANVIDAPDALRASPDATGEDEQMDIEKVPQDDDFVANGDSDASLSEMSDIESLVKTNVTPIKPSKKGEKVKQSQARAEEDPAVPPKSKKEATKEPQFLDPEADGEEDADEEEIKAALSRPPPVNSDYLPLPWKGRLGYVSHTAPAFPDGD